MDGSEDSVAGAKPGAGRSRQSMMATLDSPGEDLGKLMLSHKAKLGGAAPPGPANKGIGSMEHPTMDDLHGKKEIDGESRITDDAESAYDEESEGSPELKATKTEVQGINRMLAALGGKVKKSHRY